jgi:anthranilate/para-aminobenzoate synthase component II
MRKEMTDDCCGSMAFPSLALLETPSAVTFHPGVAGSREAGPWVFVTLTRNYGIGATHSNAGASRVMGRATETTTPHPEGVDSWKQRESRLSVLGSCFHRESICTAPRRAQLGEGP